jgi:hypothetical protein
MTHRESRCRRGRSPWGAGGAGREVEGGIGGKGKWVQARSSSQVRRNSSQSPFCRPHLAAPVQPQSGRRPAVPSGPIRLRV